MSGDSIISQLPAASPLTGAEFIPVDQGGITKRATLTMLGYGSGQIIIAGGKIFVVNAALTLNGTDGTSILFPTTNSVMARTDAAQTFSGLQTFTNGIGTPAQITSTIATGTAPFVVTSTTPVANLSIGGTAQNVTGTVAVGNGGTGATTAPLALTALGAYPASNPSGYTSNTGTVTSVGGTGTVSGLSLSGTVTTTGNLTLGGTLAVTASNFASQTAATFLAAPTGIAGVPTFRVIAAADVPTLNQSTSGTAANVTGTVAVANGGTGQTSEQLAINALSAVAAATNEYVLTKDTGTGNAIFKAAIGSSVIVAYGAIGGFILSSIAGNSTTASFTISGGGATADLGSATANTTQVNKSTSTSWAASNGNAINGTDAASSTLANSTTYHVYMCTGATGTGSYVSASLTPTFPAGYAVSARRVGSFHTTAAGAPIPYISIEIAGGATLNWLVTQTLDVSTTVQGTTRIAYALNVPTGIKVQAIIRSSVGPLANGQIILTSGDETDVAPPANNSYGFLAVPGFDMANSTAASWTIATPILITNTSGQIGARSYAANTSLYVVTRGFNDARRS
jgi:hypothetical protein